MAFLPNEPSINTHKYYQHVEGLPWNIQLPAIPLNVRSVRYHIELLYECHMSRSSSGYHNPYFYPPFEPFEPLR